MTDWTNARVVRQEDAGLFFRTEDPLVSALGSLWRDQQGALWPLRDMAALMPFTPILDADGLPVVRTVGDLTLRQLRFRPQVRLRVGDDEGVLVAADWLVTLDGRLLGVDLDTPCDMDGWKE